VDKLDSKIMEGGRRGGNRRECRGPRIGVNDESASKDVRVVVPSMKKIQRSDTRFHAGMLRLCDASGRHWWEPVVVDGVEVERRVGSRIRDGQLGPIERFPNETGDLMGLPGWWNAKFKGFASFLRVRVDCHN